MGFFDLFRSGMSNNDFCNFCTNASAMEIQKALNEGARVNGKDKSGWIPLMLAAARNTSVEAIKALLNAGADLWFVDEIGSTVLHSAVVNRNPEVTKLLLEAGLKLRVNVRTYSGDTPLISGAMIRLRPEVIYMLAEAGGDLNARNELGCSALDYAISFYPGNNAYEMIPALIKAGARVNEQSKGNKISSLMFAATKVNDPSIFEALINGGANVNLFDSSGHTALDYARAANNNVAIEVLKKYS